MSADRPATTDVMLAMVMAGDIRSPAAFSGIPFHLTQALEELGVQVISVRAQSSQILRYLAAVPTLLRSRPVPLGAGLRQRLWIAESGIMPTRLRNAMVKRRLRTRDVDGIVQVGSEFSISTNVPLATYEDRTIVQAIDYGEPSWLRVPSVDRAWRIDQQRATYQRASVCCSLSNWEGRSIRDDYGIEVSKIRVVGVGANVNPVPADRDWSRPSFLFVGMDWARKNGDLVVDAFRRLREEVPQARLDVVGDHPPLDVAGVTAHGVMDMADPQHRRSLERLFSHATCFAMPSSHEPLGIVYAEAGSAGVPSIGGNRGGSPEIIGDGGIVVDPDRPAELLRAMRDLCDPARAATLGRRALEHSRLYTWRSVAERFLLALGIELPGISLSARFLNEPDLRSDRQPPESYL